MKSSRILLHTAQKTLLARRPANVEYDVKPLAKILMEQLDKMDIKLTEQSAKFTEQSAKLTELSREVAALKKKTKSDKPDTSFAGLYGTLMLNEDGSGKRFKHTAELKNGEDDEWFATWDAKNLVLAQEDSDAVYESFGEFGTAHYTSLGEQLKKLTKNDGNGGWDKVKFYDTTKKKFITASTLLAGKPRSVSRAKSASRRRSDAKPKTPAKKEAPVKFFYFKEEGGRISVYDRQDDVDGLAQCGTLDDDEVAYYFKNQEAVFAALCEWDEVNDRKGVDSESFESIVKQLLDD